MGEEAVVIPMDSLTTPLTLNLINEETTTSTGMVLSFSTPMTSSYVGRSIEDIEEGEKEKSRKKSKSKLDDGLQRKRKDTATSITNFFHRFTRSENKEEKKIVEEEEEEEIERPDKLMSPDSAEEMWYEPKDIVDGDLIGHEGDAELYEWGPDGLEEKIVVDPLTIEFSTLEPVEEQGLIHQLENFRSGKMHWLDDDQLDAMRKVREDHEDVTNTHVNIYELGDDADDKLIEEMFDQMNSQMIKMHAVLDTVFPFRNT